MRRPLGCWLVLLPLLLLAGACVPAVVAAQGPSLNRDRAAVLLVAAEIARADAFASADPGPLRALFSASAIAAVRPQLDHLKQRGIRVEERADARRLVHWAAAKGRGEGVLEVTAEQRVGLAAGPSGNWSRIVRQWWAVLGWSGGRWLVVSAADLPPNQWWQD